jgi:hypothetical protein
MEESGVVQALERLSGYCVSELYRGYSLYDSHTSRFPFHKLGSFASFTANQVVKRSPLNFRPLLGIEKGLNPKGVGLFLTAFTELHEMEQPPQVKLLSGSLQEEAWANLEWLLANPSPGFSGMCWGYNYPWPKRDVGLVPSYTPSSVVTGFISRGILNYYKLFGDERAAEALVSAAQFITNDIPCDESELGTCFSYLPLQKDHTVNANLLAAEVLAYADHVSGGNQYQETLRSVMRYTLNTQNEDGSWWYSFNMRGGRPKRQIDFHQGYVIESIRRICAHSTLEYEEYEGAVQKGLDFYRKNQFDDSGASYWRLPAKWPVDIHNQSQGVITFTLFSDVDAEHLDFARRIAENTVETMQGPDGRFHYQRWPMLTNRVSYMRWNQAWMYLALVRLLRATRGVDSVGWVTGAAGVQ